MGVVNQGEELTMALYGCCLVDLLSNDTDIGAVLPAIRDAITTPEL